MVRSTSRPSRRSSISIPSRDLLRVGTRASRLARAQTDIAIERMLAVRPELLIEVVEISTRGDEDKTTPLSQLGSKGIFAHELQAALIDGRVDVAVHSTKDLTGAPVDGLELVAFLERADARDVLVSRSGATLAELPPQTVVGTSSLRRRAALRTVRDDLRVVDLRGNVDTRLRKVADGEVDAAILAAAGIVRLGRQEEAAQWLDPDVFVPAPGQGAIVCESRTGDASWLAAADHAATRAAVEAERAFMHAVEGSCEVPLGAYATEHRRGVRLVAFVASVDGDAWMRDEMTGADPVSVGAELGERMLDAGARDLVRSRPGR